MYRCHWLVRTLAALLLVGLCTSSSGESGPSNPDMKAEPSSKLATTCYFGSPSESCTFTCSQNSMDAYCDEVKKQCVCKDRENKEEPESDQTESDETSEETDDDVKEQLTHETDKQQTNFHLRDICMLGYPSPSCTSHCDDLSLESYCDNEKNICSCRNPPADEGFNMDWLKLMGTLIGGDSEGPTDSQNALGEPTGSSSGINSELFNMLLQLQSGLFDNLKESEEDTSEEVSSEQDDTRHYVFYVFDLDSLFNDTESTSDPNTIELPSTHPVLRHIGRAIEGWALSHILAVVLIVFLFGLVLLELAFWIKKDKPDDQMQTIFPTK